MEKLVLLSKCDPIFAGFITILPEHFCILIEGAEDTPDLDINFVDKDSNIITSTSLYIDDKHKARLKCFGTMERIEINEAMMERISEDISSFAVSNTIEGYEDETFIKGVVPMDIFMEIWDDYLCEKIDEITERYHS